MKGKILLFLFALPFFSVGVWMGYSIGSAFYESYQMQQWHVVPATLTSAGYNSHPGDDSTTYEAYARYTYVIDGQHYSGDRVSISGGSDNIGDYQQDTGSYLSGLLVRGESVSIYVNPNDPSISIIDPTIRWGLIGFKSIFFFVFGGVGLGLIIWVFKAPKEKDLTEQKYVAQPWLANDDWQSATIKSNSKATMYFTWGFAAIWNLISAPLPFLMHKEVLEKQNYAALLGLLFPLVGIYLIIWAAKRTREWNRFGPAPVTLDPFPGSIGGHVGGTIDINLPFDARNRFSATLTSLRSYISGSGKNKSRKESAEWQDVQVAKSTTGAKGTRLTFRFEVPQGQQQADASQLDDSYFIWRLNLKSELEGADFDRDYEIPVYATSQQSKTIRNFSAEQAKSKQKEIDSADIQSLFSTTQTASGTAMRYPIGRNIGGGIGGLLFGVIFGGIGWFLISSEGHTFMGSIFGFFGVLIGIFSLYSMLNSLEVYHDGNDLVSVRRILGIPVRTTRIRRSDILRFEKDVGSKTQSGSKHVVRYSVSVVASDGSEMKVGEGFKGVSQANAAVAYMTSLFSLRSLEQENDDFLTAD